MQMDSNSTKSFNACIKGHRIIKDWNNLPYEIISAPGYIWD